MITAARYPKGEWPAVGPFSPGGCPAWHRTASSMTYQARAFMLVVGFLAAELALPEQELRAQGSVAPPPIIVPQLTPQFNDPGPQLVIPPPGNPVQQLSPSLGTGSQGYSAPQVYAVPEESPHVLPSHSRHHRAKHREIDRSHSDEGGRAVHRSSTPRPAKGATVK